MIYNFFNIRYLKLKFLSHILFKTNNNIFSKKITEKIIVSPEVTKLHFTLKRSIVFLKSRNHIFVKIIKSHSLSETGKSYF